MRYHGPPDQRLIQVVARSVHEPVRILRVTYVSTVKMFRQCNNSKHSCSMQTWSHFITFHFNIYIFGFFKNYLEDVSSFSGLLMPFFWTSGEACPGLKARKGPLLACFRACIQWIPQIHLWCDTGLPR